MIIFIFKYGNICGICKYNNILTTNRSMLLQCGLRLATTARRAMNENNYFIFHLNTQLAQLRRCSHCWKHFFKLKPLNGTYVYVSFDTYLSGKALSQNNIHFIYSLFRLYVCIQWCMQSEQAWSLENACQCTKERMGVRGTKESLGFFAVGYENWVYV